jgi:Protein of unknown function (DUF1559)
MSWNSAALTEHQLYLQIADAGYLTARTASLSVFLCPSNVGSDPVTASSFTGAVINTDLSAGQYVASAGQLEPREYPDTNNGVFYWSLHPGGCNFVSCDGSVRFVKESVNPNVLSYLSSRARGEIVSCDQF